MDQHFMYLNSDQPSNNAHTNSSLHFVVDLGRDVNLQGKWEMALLETNRKNVNVHCDWCEYATHPSQWQILRQVGSKLLFPYYVPVREGNKRNIEIKMNKNGTGTTTLVIHLRKL